MAKLNAAGSGLAYATFLGGNDDGEARPLLWTEQVAFTEGGTGSTDFPTIA